VFYHLPIRILRILLFYLLRIPLHISFHLAMNKPHFHSSYCLSTLQCIFFHHSKCRFPLHESYSGRIPLNKKNRLSKRTYPFLVFFLHSIILHTFLRLSRFQYLYHVAYHLAILLHRWIHLHWNICPILLLYHLSINQYKYLHPDESIYLCPKQSLLKK